MELTAENIRALKEILKEIRKSLSNGTESESVKFLAAQIGKDRIEYLTLLRSVEGRRSHGYPGSRASRTTPLDRKVWLTTTEAAEYLGTTRGGVSNRVYRGQLKPHKPFGHRGRCYYKRSHLDWLLERAL